MNADISMFLQVVEDDYDSEDEVQLGDCLYNTVREELPYKRPVCAT